MISYLKIYLTFLICISLTLIIIPNANSENCHPGYKQNIEIITNPNSTNDSLKLPIKTIKVDSVTNKKTITSNLPSSIIDIHRDIKPNSASHYVKIECQSANSELCAKLLNNNPPGKDISAIAISILALLASLGGLGYNFYKDNKSRMRSINDDFWIRKIISPVTIEPLVKEILDVVANLPEDSSKTEMLPEAYKQFTETYHPKIQQLSSNLQALKLLSSTIYKDSDKALSNIEDLVLNYCGSNASQLMIPNSITINSKAETRDKIIENMLSILINSYFYV